MLTQSETIPDLKPFSYRAHPRGRVYLVKEFLCSHPSSFIVHLELDWLLPGNLGWEWLLPDNFLKLYCVLNVLTMNHLAPSSLVWSMLTKSAWTGFSFSPLCSLLLCLDTCRGSSVEPLILSGFVGAKSVRERVPIFLPNVDLLWQTGIRNLCSPWVWGVPTNLHC